MTKRMLRLLPRGRMRLIADWPKVLRHSSSIQLIAIAALLSGAEAILPLVDYRIPGPPWLHAMVLFLTVTAAGIARLVAQKALSGK